MEFHYNKAHNSLSVNCPPLNYKTENTIAFRWVFDTIENNKNFISQFEKKPKRFNSSSDKTKCKSMAISMYKDIDSAIDKFIFLKEEQGMSEKAFTILGTNIAKGNLHEEDGVNERGKNGEQLLKGHFSHHPAKEYDYVKKFKIIASFIK